MGRKLARRKQRKIRHFRIKSGTRPQRLLGLLLGTGKEIGQKLTGASPVTIPETLAGRISAPVYFSFQGWHKTGTHYSFAAGLFGFVRYRQIIK